jgi:hypothetical protein
MGATCLSIATTAWSDAEHFSVLAGGKIVGSLEADTTGARTSITYDYKNNGRGPTIAETIEVDPKGLPTRWHVSGTTTFGTPINESYQWSAGTATWEDSIGKDHHAAREPALYVAQNTSPWAIGLYARALLKTADGSGPVLPSGTLHLEKDEPAAISNADTSVPATAYILSGINLRPDIVLLDNAGAMVAYLAPNLIVVRKGYESAGDQLSRLAVKLLAKRYEKIERVVAHRYSTPVRVTNVRIFDPATSTLTSPVSVVVNGNQIASIEPIDNPPTEGEVTFDGAGGTLIAGMVSVHEHLTQDDALLDLMAGITTIRDMGNVNDMLDELVRQIDSGAVGGPRVVRSGFLEGKSPFNSNAGIVVDSEQAAINAVRWYSARGFWQIKIYNSMNPAWVPAIAREAHGLGMRIAGHIPAFSTADAMIEAGYDEMTHMNQFMLGWVLKPEEDTRTLLRFTAIKRFATLNLESAPVQHTIQLMVSRKIAIDPTLGVHEAFTVNRNGQMPVGARDYLDHMPIGYQRSARVSPVQITGADDDRSYRAAFEKILATVRILHDRGIFIVFGTDSAGSFTYHRELELYQRAGMSPPEILKRATYDTQRYLGQDQRLGSIAKGKLADFFLVPGDPTKTLRDIKTIEMVVKDGKFYFPAEVYPWFGIRPFTESPKINAAKAISDSPQVVPAN